MDRVWGSPWYAVRFWGWVFLRELGAKTTVGGLIHVCGIVSLLTEKSVPYTTAITDKVRRNENLPFPTHARSDMSDAYL
jgi:hypothetical protein